MWWEQPWLSPDLDLQGVMTLARKSAKSAWCAKETALMSTRGAIGRFSAAVCVWAHLKSADYG